MTFRTLLHLRYWLTTIQSELDASWAVLGEVYGPHAELSKLGLRLRRVRSNLEDQDRLAKDLTFVPQRIVLDVARADLLKLLIRPLYGDRPEVGIRELLQNALDAVREFAVYVEKRPELKDVARVQQSADVQIWLADVDKTGHALLSVSDRGIGMTEEVVRDYFLRAGASYRYTEAWRATFEKDQVDALGVKRQRSQVLRSGRFGIGALAAFLLSDAIEVFTRHATASRGLHFITTLDADPIQLDYDASLPVGTTIRLRLTQSICDKLVSKARYRFADSGYSWDWYCLGAPITKRLLGLAQSQLRQKDAISEADLSNRAKWRRIDHPDYEAIYWSYTEDPVLSCNGIRVGYPDDHPEPKQIVPDIFDDPVYRVRTPNVCVFEPGWQIASDITERRIG